MVRGAATRNRAALRAVQAQTRGGHSQRVASVPLCFRFREHVRVCQVWSVFCVAKKSLHRFDDHLELVCHLLVKPDVGGCARARQRHRVREQAGRPSFCALADACVRAVQRPCGRPRASGRAHTATTDVFEVGAGHILLLHVNARVLLNQLDELRTRSAHTGYTAVFERGGSRRSVAVHGKACGDVSLPPSA